MEEQGRIQVKFQSQRDSILEQMGEVLPGFYKGSGKFVCNRCGNQNVEEFAVGPCIICQKNCHYCLRCLNMGKVKECCVLVAVEEQTPAFPPHSVQLYYKHTMSKEQEKLSKELVEVTDKEHLVWAVTGAGKTEMIFELIRTVLEKGGRVGLAAPRIDVCNEVAPRIKEAFPLEEVTVLHGLTDESYKRTPITIATTHQMLRFYYAFDVLIVDEVDAFPYSNSDMLQFAVHRAVKPVGRLVFMTATPSKLELYKIQHHQLSYSLLPARFHRHPLVVPLFKELRNWNSALEKKKIPQELYLWMKKRLDEKTPFLIFVSTIGQICAVEEMMSRAFSNASFSSVSSQEDQRQERIQQMRDGKLDFLITTTILERGVTFYGIDVAVTEAQEEIFTREVLVQIAGRVGRSVDHPGGEVVYFYEGMSRAMKQAKKEIESLNEEARKRGLIEGD
ncbi:helicase-related protein [uncultured Granulicatella sp.]|uniref:DEAD/DEAH box helicase n=1 Tax=uncultured Granulicatella sp. TaxID=316089 RepID=UPI0028E58043|nr:helicase-related protein [uncultured Granulicatella sp.]